MRSTRETAEMSSGTARIGTTGPSLAVLGRYANRQGGVSKCLVELADRAAKTYDVHMVAHEVLDRPSSAIDVRRVPMTTRPKVLQQRSFARSARGPVANLSPALVHSHGPQFRNADIYTAHSCHAAWIGDRRRMSGWRGAASRVYPPHVLALDWERRCFESTSARRIISVSHRVKDELHECLEIPRELITVVPNGVDTNVFAPEPPRGTVDVLDEEDLRGVRKGPVFLFVGYEFDRKGLAPAMRGLVSSGLEDAELWVAGSADRSAYERLAADLGIAERVRFLGHKSDIARYFRAADAFVLPTAYEAFELVSLEALASGVPLIVSTRAGAAEVLEGPAREYLIDDPRDWREVGSHMRRFADQRDQWPEMRDRARALGLRHDWDAIWAQTDQVYRAVLEEKGFEWSK